MISIAIDGPSGVGKSTVAKILSRKFGFLYLDTGALYRAMGYFFIMNCLDYSNKNIVSDNIKNIDISFRFEGHRQKMFLCGKDITSQIRTDDVSMAASCVSAMPIVREFLLNMQRNMALNNNIIMDGRDIGTVVLPNADIKIFLNADVRIRARRRFGQVRRREPQASYYNVFNSIKKRDKNDTERAVAPLVPAKDAIILNTTRYSLNKTIYILTNIIREYINGKEKFIV